MGLEHTFEAFGLTCATSLEWPAPCGTRTSTSYESIPMLSYWLIGASSGEVHVLTGDELKRPRSVPLHTLKSEPVLYRGPGGGVLLGSASCAHRTSIAISTIAVHTPQIKPDESRPKVEELTQSALVRNRHTRFSFPLRTHSQPASPRTCVDCRLSRWHIESVPSCRCPRCSSTE